MSADVRPIADADRTRRQHRARRHERSLYLSSHPLMTGLFALLRIGPGIVRVPGTGIVVSDAVVARQILLDDSFRKSGPGSAGHLIAQVMGDRALFNQDGEDHRLVRGRLQELFTPRAVASMTDEVIGPAVAGLRERYARGDEIDMVRFAHQMTGRFICFVLGIPLRDIDDDTCEGLFHQGADLVRSITLRTTSLSATEAAVAHRRFLTMTESAVAAWASPQDSVMRRLHDMEFAVDDARALAGMLILAGTETVSTALPRLLALLIDTGQWHDLQSKPRLIDTAIAEAVRVTAPTPVMVRIAAADVSVGEFAIRRGERVVILTYNVVRDRREIADWKTFDSARIPPPAMRRMAFGAGPHFCLGYSMALRELERPLGALLDEPGTPHIVGRRAARQVLIPAYRRLVIRRP